MSELTANDKVTGQRRAYALDALRGIALMMMILCPLMPPGLPSFMFHAQDGPPTFTFNPNNPGVTWVDMVFPFFLFSMGAAIPFAVSRRLQQGVGARGIISSAMFRGLLLGFFSLYIQNARPDPMAGSPVRLMFFGLAGFAIPFLALCRLPSTWKPWIRGLVKVAGLASAIVLVMLARYKDDLGPVFTLARFDIIIAVLSNMALYTTIIYFFTKKNMLHRLGILGFITALRLASVQPGWVHSFVTNFPIPYADSLAFLGPTPVAILKMINTFFGIGLSSYLYISIPGTIIGDMIIRWMETPHSEDNGMTSWPKSRYAGLAILLFLTDVLCLTLFKGRHIWQLALLLVPTFIVGGRLVSFPKLSIEKLICGIYNWGVYLLTLGMLFEPYEGGIKKDPPTMSFLMAASGLAIFTLIVFTVIIDVFNSRRSVRLFVDTGQNPMLGYMVRSNVLCAVLNGTGLAYFLTTRVFVSPWAVCFLAFIEAILSLVFISFFTRRKLFWRT